MKTYVVSSEAWYSRFGVYKSRKDCVEEILLSFDETSPEVPLRWYDFNGTSAVRLEVFSDNWEALEHPDFEGLFGTLLAYKGEGAVLIPSFVVGILKELGWEDKTERDRPNDEFALHHQAIDIAQKLVVQQPDEAIRLLAKILMEKEK